MPLSAKRLRQVRENKKLTQRDLAQLCDITEYQVSRYENEKSDISGDTLELVAKHLEVSTDYLLGISNNPRGQLGDSEFSEAEYDLIQTLRREGWIGVIHYSADRVAELPLQSPNLKNK